MSRSRLFGIIVAVVGTGVIIFAVVNRLYIRPSLMMATGNSGFVTESFGLSASGEMYREGMAQAPSSKMMALDDRSSLPIEPPGQGSVAADVPLSERLIIKSANVSLLVKDVPEAITKIQQFATLNKGFVVSSNIDKQNLGFSGFVTFRIPSETFDASLNSLSELGEVKSRQVSGEDVTEQFVDVEAQLNNLRATERQFLDIMKRAGRIEDILAVQRELSNVRSQIDQLEGRRKYLKESAAMSLVTVNLATNPSDLPVIEKEPSWKPLAVFKDAVRDLLDIGKGIVNFLIAFIVFAPLWGLLALLGWLGYRFWKRKNS